MMSTQAPVNFQTSLATENQYQLAKEKKSRHIDIFSFACAALGLALALSFNSVHDIGSYDKLFFLGMAPLAYRFTAKLMPKFVKSKHLFFWGVLFVVAVIVNMIVLSLNVMNPDNIVIPSWAFLPAYLPFIYLCINEIRLIFKKQHALASVQELIGNIYQGYLPHELSPGGPKKLVIAPKAGDKKPQLKVLLRRIFGLDGTKGLIDDFSQDPGVRGRVCASIYNLLVRNYRYSTDKILTIMTDQTNKRADLREIFEGMKTKIESKRKVRDASSSPSTTSAS